MYILWKNKNINSVYYNIHMYMNDHIYIGLHISYVYEWSYIYIYINTQAHSSCSGFNYRIGIWVILMFGFVIMK